MNSIHRKARWLVSTLVSFATLVAADTKSRDTDQERRPTLKLNVDRKPIDRNAPERVSYAPVIEKSAASVVFVYSTKQVRAQEMPFLDDPILRRFFGIPGGPGGRVPDQTQRGLGSGVIISSDGYVLTNNHVIEGADDVKVSIGESLRRYDATVVGSDALADLAVLKIEAENLQPATLGDSDQLKVGDVVLAIGNPFGVGQSVTRGIVSALGRGNLGIEQIEDFIQTDAAINMGNSGGALIDVAGRLVGINTAILSRTGGFAGVGFAIPINLARNVSEQIVNTGEVSRGFLGVAPQTLTPELATQFGTHRGALISEVTPGSAAEKAGLQAGDVITKVNGLEISDPRQLLLTVSQLAPGSSAKIEYMRDGKPATATAQLERRPEQSLAGSADGTRRDSDDGVLDGVAVADISPQMRDQLQIPSRVQGAIVTRVDPTSPSARQGLQEGDVILELDRKPVKNAQEAVELSAQIKGPKVMVRVWREGRSLYLVVDESTK
jgi:serine protease Do